MGPSVPMINKTIDISDDMVQDLLGDLWSLRLQKALTHQVGRDGARDYMDSCVLFRVLVDVWPFVESAPFSFHNMSVLPV